MRRIVASLLQPPLLLAICAVFAAGSLSAAIIKPLWFDELITYYVATQPDVSHLWGALATGADQTPPVYHLLVHAANRLFGPGALATRLPATLGVLAVVPSLFVFLRFRVSVAAAITGALVPLLAASGAYAYEGRAYGVVLGLSAVAIVCWQRASSRVRRDVR